MELRFKQVKIKISFFFALSICLISLFDKSNMILLNLISAFLHEAGHLSALIILKQKPKEVWLTPFGMRIEQKEINGMSYKNEIIVALAGPAVNFFLSFIFFIAELILKIDFSKFIMINLIIGSLNMIICEPLDGYRAMKYFLKNKISEEKTERILNVSSLVFLLPVSVFGFYVLIKSGYNFSLLLISVYLCSFLIFKKRPI